jgi:hypothetical protein
MEFADGNVSFRTVYASVRPARIAFLVHQEAPDWQEMCLRLIECTANIWGGWYSCIIPTDGKTVTEPFLSLLKQFDPDYVYRYRRKVLDMKLSDPTSYSDWKAKEIQHRQGLDGWDQKSFENEFDELELDDCSIDADLHNTLLRKINPFHYEENAINGSITARNLSVSYPLTSIDTLLPNIADPIQTLEVHDTQLDASPWLRLMVHASVGKLWPELVASLESKGVPVLSDNCQVPLARHKIVEG